jgi:hypothetical protein
MTEKEKDSNFDEDSLLEFGEREKSHSKTKPSTDEKSEKSRLSHLEMEKPVGITINPEEKKVESEDKPQSLKKSKKPEGFEFPPEDTGKPDLKPWEIDDHGVPLEYKKKHRKPTPYEIWLEKKRQTEGSEVICPRCGTVNLELPFVSGEKCFKCGYNIDYGENIAQKMRDSVKSSLVDRLQSIDTIDALSKTLDLPANFENIIDNPDSPFEYTYRAYSYFISLIILSASIITFYLLMTGVWTVEDSSNWNLFLMVITVLFAIFSTVSLLDSIRVISIYLDQDSVTFKGLFFATRMNYKNVFSIQNARLATGGIPVLSSIFLIFSSIRFYHLMTQFEEVASEPADNSSTSREFRNHISISSFDDHISFSFSGGDNPQFVRALAIIILMSKLKNPSCFIDKKSLLAAEKGYDDYSNWQSREIQNKPDPHS